MDQHIHISHNVCHLANQLPRDKRLYIGILSFLEEKDCLSTHYLLKIGKYVLISCRIFRIALRHLRRYTIAYKRIER